MTQEELELEAMDMLKNKWSHLHTFGYQLELQIHELDQKFSEL